MPVLGAVRRLILGQSSPKADLWRDVVIHQGEAAAQDGADGGDDGALRLVRQIAHLIEMDARLDPLPDMPCIGAPVMANGWGEEMTTRRAGDMSRKREHSRAPGARAAA